MPAALPHPFLPLIAETIATTGAKKILCFGDLPWPDSAPTPVQLTADVWRTTSALPARADLAVVSLAGIEHARDARQFIALLRDILAKQFIVFIPDNLLDDAALMGLALTRQAHFEHHQHAWQAWSYDIRTYKSVPDWLNPKFWANPENWGKHRW